MAFPNTMLLPRYMMVGLYKLILACIDEGIRKTSFTVTSTLRERYYVGRLKSSYLTFFLQIHGTGFFLPWHRWYIQALENAMKERCNLTTHSPYWDWTKGMIS
jgi:hypothetical protein